MSNRPCRYPHGTQIRFDCLPTNDDVADEGLDDANDGKLRSWKIVCKSGSWVGESHGCDENGNPVSSYMISNSYRIR
jgi:hypothetical protein